MIDVQATQDEIHLCAVKSGPALLLDDDVAPSRGHLLAEARFSGTAHAVQRPAVPAAGIEAEAVAAVRLEHMLGIDDRYPARAGGGEHGLGIGEHLGAVMDGPSAPSAHAFV